MFVIDERIVYNLCMADENNEKVNKKPVLPIILISVLAGIALIIGGIFIFRALSKGGKDSAGKGDIHLSGEIGMYDSLCYISEGLSSLGNRLSLDPRAMFGLPENLDEYKQFVIEISAEDSLGSSYVLTQRTVNAGNGDGEQSLELRYGSRLLHAGIFFTGSDMILQRSDAAKPYIIYHLAEDQAAALKDVSLVERMWYCLSSDDPSDMIRTGFADGSDRLSEIFDSKAGEIVTSPKEIESGGASLYANVSSLSLKGEDASALIGLIADSWELDHGISRAFMPGNFTSDESMGSAFKRTKKLADEGKNAKLSLETGVIDDKPGYLNLEYTCDTGALSVTVFYEASGISSYQISFPEGDGFECISRTEGMHNHTSHRIYGTDGKTRYETRSDSDLSESGGERTSEYDMAAMSFTDGKLSREYTCKGSFTSKENGKSLDCTFSGHTTADENGEKSSADYNGELTMEKDWGSPAVPYILEESARSASTRQELFSRFYPGSEDEGAGEMTRFDKLSPLQQYYMSMLLMFL